MADDSVPIFSKVEATLNDQWIKNYGSDITNLLSTIENATKKNIEIRFRNGRYTVHGSLLHINAVHDLLFDKDIHPHLQLELTDEYLMSGPPSFFYPNKPHEALCGHREGNIEESELEFVTTYTDGTAGAGQKSFGWHSENSVSDVSEISEVVQRSACTESFNVETHDRSADAIDADDRVEREDISRVGIAEKGAGMNYTSTRDTDTHDKSCDVDTNEKSSVASDSVAVDINKQDKCGISNNDGDQTIDTNDKRDIITNDGDNTIDISSRSHDEDNSTVAPESNKELENDIFSDERMVDPEIWDYMLEIKIDHLLETLKPFGASYRSEWDATDDVYKVRLVIQNQSTNEHSKKLITSACEQFDRLYNETFDSCEVVPMNTKYFLGGVSVNHVRTKFPSIFLKPSSESVMLIGQKDDVQKAKKYLESNYKTTGRKHKSVSRSRSSMELITQSGGATTEHRLCQSAIFPGNYSLASSEDAESLVARLEGLKLGPTDEMQEKGEKTCNQLVSRGTDRDGCGDGSTMAEFEHLDNDNLQEKDSSSESFSILQSSPNSSFDDAFAAQK